jgi:threonylcarbamoyladenosine tRNA methylthiotransferase MtaB
MPKRRAAFHNLGCKVNAWETEAMEQMLENAGYEIVPFGEKADVTVINTCSVTNIADRKSRQMLHRAKKLNPEGAVVAVGCYVQAAAETLEEDSAVDLLIGNDRRRELPELLEEWFSGKKPAADEAVIDIASSPEFENLTVTGTKEHSRAFIKVQDGCNQFCSYCIIPYTRGRVRSRRPEDVLREAGALAKAGYREIVVTGIHLASYGMDFREKKSAELDGRELLSLLIRLDRIPGIERIRLGSLEPRIVTREFAQTLAALQSICPHFHLSLQSGSQATLRRMNRHYTPEEYARGVQELREAFADPAVTTDVIVGFPGETDAEFQESRAFLEKIGFYEMHVFRYSRRRGTRADAMENQIPEPVKEERSADLIALGHRMSLAYREKWLNRVSDLLLEQEETIGGKRYLSGLSREYVRGAVPLADGDDGKNMQGKILRGTFSRKITDEVLEFVPVGD